MEHRPIASWISSKARKGTPSGIAGRGGFGGNVLLVAMRDVAAGEMPCSCGTPPCRGVISGRDWRRPDLQERYRGWFSWYLARRIEQSS